MAGLSFIALGVGDAFSARFYSSCLAVNSGDAWLLVDCPHPIRKILRESGTAAGVSLDVDSFHGVALTHVHADHSSGLEDWGYFAHYRLARSPVLFAHPTVAAGLWHGHLLPLAGEHVACVDPDCHYLRLAARFRLTALSEREPVQAGPFCIECHFTRHNVPTTALRIRADGRCLGYSADTEFDPELLQWLSAADLIIHETNEGPHTAYADLVQLPAQLRARMRLIHYPDDFDIAHSAIQPLTQGQRYAV